MVSFLSKYAVKVFKSALIGIFVGLIGFGLGLSQPVYAATDQPAGQYVAADGTDLTAIAQCLPVELSQPDLKRALQESGNDFLEKVFSIKDNYEEYDLADEESKYLECLNSKGVVSQVQQ